jgi:hypothetical protein
MLLFLGVEYLSPLYKCDVSNNKTMSQGGLK